MEVKSKEEITQANSEVLDQIHGLLDRVAKSEMTWDKERAGFLVRLSNELSDVLTNDYEQLLEDSKSMTEYTTTVVLSKGKRSNSR